MANRIPIEAGEWYHCYNRGVDKRKVFLGLRDYERILILMYLAKNALPVRLFSIKNARLEKILTGVERSDPIVEIGAYSLMPNHFHFVLREIREGGIALFMQKVFTGFTMYFNQKSGRTGALFAGTYKSKHVANDVYFKYLISYVHINAAELFEPTWKDGVGDIREMEKNLLRYPYSSLLEFTGQERPQKHLLDASVFELFDHVPSIHQMLKEARAYENLPF